MINQLIHEFSLGDELIFDEISPGFPVIKINNSFATATISIYGGHLLYYKPHDQVEQVIWLSDQSVYKQNKAIRGGIPVCWPWFGDFEDYILADGSLPAKSSFTAHVYARTASWNIQSTEKLSDGGTQVTLNLPCDEGCQQFMSANTDFNCALTLKIIVDNELKLELTTTNHGQVPVSISEALHSYFKVSDIHNIRLQGLEQLSYRDKVNDGKLSLQNSELYFKNETDRVFIDASDKIHLLDKGFNRIITLSKSNSDSTVIWNPWQEKTSLMDDMSDQA
jgi:glucose-6-phosphate 1-epimerase